MKEYRIKIEAELEMIVEADSEHKALELAYESAHMDLSQNATFSIVDNKEVAE
ncbi:hypothetical protein [Jeotgalibaca porci]|uniref:hypothetical protein n=1 Tax=Jeotgalibaca porci TaxID=1868793 RepID=UPI0035A096EC